MFRILIIDASSRLKTLSEDFWQDTGYRVELVQVNTMQDAISITAKAMFWYIDINADTIDYVPSLSVLRANTKTPIIALTSNFNHEDEVASYHGGLDIYTTWEIGVEQQTPESVIAYMSRYENRPPTEEMMNPKTLVCDTIILSCDFHRCFIGDVEIPMTKTEFNILYYLMLNRGLVLSPRQIYFFAWGEDVYDETLPEVIRSHMKRLRKKIEQILPIAGHIENVRGVGYRFVS